MSIQPSTIQGWLVELEGLSDSARIQQALFVGGGAASEDYRQALLPLGVYGRRLALYLALAQGNGAAIAAAVGDASGFVVALAAKLLPKAATVAEFVDAMRMVAGNNQRPYLLGWLKQGREQVAVDTVVQTLLADDNSMALNVLDLASWPVIEQQLGLLEQAAQYIWRRVARRHPTMLVEHLRQQANSDDNRWQWRAFTVFEILNKRRYPLAQVLFEHLLALGLGQRLMLSVTLSVRPQQAEAMAKALLKQPISPFRQLYLSHCAHHLRPATLFALLEHAPQMLNGLENRLKRFPVAQRSDLYARLGRSWYDVAGVLPLEVAEQLPAPQRQALARLHLGLPALATRPAQRVPYAGLLPWAEAEATLAPELRQNEAERRGAALAALVSSARFERQRYGEAATLVLARRFEQDPVRLLLLTALVALPPSGWQPDHLPLLGQVIEQALAAPDLSHQSSQALEQLVTRLWPTQPAWSRQWWLTLLAKRGHWQGYGLEAVLSAHEAAILDVLLLPLLQKWQAREYEQRILWLMPRLGKRIRQMPAVLALLKQLCLSAHHDTSALEALRLLAQHDRPTFIALVPQSLQQDASWASQAIVYDYLHRQRQDLLTPFLGQNSFKGRFSSGKVKLVLPFHSGFIHWSRPQQQLFAKSLESLITDDVQTRYVSLQALARLAALPDVLSNRLVLLSEQNNPDELTRHQAITMLGRLDAGRGVPLLLAALEDQRARFAIYALRGALLAMNPSQALAILAAVSTKQVTVAKETVRLIGELRNPQAFAVLLDWNQRDLHRDVRVALLRALWDYPQYPETWAIFTTAAADLDEAIAAGVLHLPVERLNPSAQQQALAVLVPLLQHPARVLRLQALKRCRSLPIYDQEHVILPSLIESLTSPIFDEVEAAIDGLVEVYAKRDQAAIALATRQLLDQPRSLLLFTTALVGFGQFQAPATPALMQLVVQTLAADPKTLHLQAELACLFFPATELLAWLGQHAEHFYFEAQQMALQALQIRLQERKSLQALEATLRGHALPMLRRLGLAVLVNLARSPAAWDDELLALLRHYRQDQALAVASAAAFVLPTLELLPAAVLEPALE
jgi:hypothetical protein